MAETGEHDTELIASKAESVSVTTMSPDRLGASAENLVAYIMTQTVVHLLEGVDIGKDEKHGRLHFSAVFQFSGEPHVESTSIPETREWVFEGQALVGPQSNEFPPGFQRQPGDGEHKGGANHMDEGVEKVAWAYIGL